TKWRPTQIHPSKKFDGDGYGKIHSFCNVWTSYNNLDLDGDCIYNISSVIVYGKCRRLTIQFLVVFALVFDSKVANLVKNPQGKPVL
ncbi:MAG TPA: hypothetical protein VFM31_00920, partial [Nitrososphaeraceae archaeon]|nr:hypothetical protein [Nitrososphaeraceae archaeon]